MTKSITWWR